MAIVTGVLADFGRAALANSSVDRHPVIRFRPSGPAVKASGSVLYATRVITTIPAVSTGAWTVDLEQTNLLSPETWYNVSITWLDAENNFVSEDEVPGRLYVPGGGGLFTDLYRVEPNPLQVWISEGGVLPPDARPQDLVFDPISDNLYQVT